MEKIDKLFDFFREIDKEKSIRRGTYLTDGVTKEDDSEHAWHMAVMAIFLEKYSNEKIDLLRTIEMLLIHDLPEIYAGDTYCYDEQAKKTQKEREEKGAEKLFSILDDDDKDFIYRLWREFEAGETAEAKFAKTLDNLQPCMMNSAIDGEGWVENDVSLSAILKRNEKTADGSESLWEYQLENFIMPNVEKGRIKNK